MYCICTKLDYSNKTKTFALAISVPTVRRGIKTIQLFCRLKMLVNFNKCILCDNFVKKKYAAGGGGGREEGHKIKKL